MANEIEITNGVNLEQPRTALTAVANQKVWQWVNNNDFYKMLPAPYYSFYNNWVRLWLYWYDGYVPWVHGTQYGLLSTSIGATIVNRAADSVFGGNLMFANARKPSVYIDKNGKHIAKALDFISNEWSLETDFRSKVKCAFRDAFAGGFSLIKLNNDGGRLWVDKLRADRFYFEKTGRGQLRKVVSLLNVYQSTTQKGGDKRYGLIEERRFEQIGMFGDEVPVVEYKMYDTSVQVQYLSVNDNYVAYEDLPKDVKKAFKADYNACMLNKPLALNGFKSLGCYILKGSDDISDVPQLGLGESLLANVMTYLYEYDFYNTCFNTDMYLARGRILVPKALQSPQAKTGAQNAGLDSFLFTKVETMSTDEQKPEPIQFELRSAAWREARNILLESIATGIGISVSTLASYLTDGGNRTAREVSAEESATTLFIENARRRFEKPLNDLIADVLRFYGYVDDVEVRWSRAGMTNTTVLVDTLTKAVQAGLISRRKAHDAFNFDDDEEQNAEDYKLVQQEESERTQRENYGGGMFDDQNYYGDEAKKDADSERQH